jgi:glycerol-3-phosphate acyltransferase PlsY
MLDEDAMSTIEKSMGAWLIIATALIGLCISLYNYFIAGSGVDHTAGALLVVCSTALMLLAALAIALAELPAWLAVLLAVAIALDIAGTGLAAYFLETDVLLAFMAVAAIGWIAHVLMRALGASSGVTVRTEGQRA